MTVDSLRLAFCVLICGGSEQVELNNTDTCFRAAGRRCSTRTAPGVSGASGTVSHNIAQYIPNGCYMNVQTTAEEECPGFQSSNATARKSARVQKMVLLGGSHRELSENEAFGVGIVSDIKKSGF